MSSAQRHKKQISDQILSTFWMITFSDLIMLLLTFFVMLLTMKSMNHKDLRKYFPNASLRGGPLEFSKTGLTGNAPDLYGDNPSAAQIDNAETLKQIFAVMKDLSTSLPQKEAVLKRFQELMQITDTPKGVVVSFQAKTLFFPGTAEIDPSKIEYLDAAGELLKWSTNPIIIIGHIEKGNGNWSLSLHQALQVLYYLVDNLDMMEERLATGGTATPLPENTQNGSEPAARGGRIEFILQKQ